MRGPEPDPLTPAGEEARVADEPERLLREEEPEAFLPQNLRDEIDTDADADELAREDAAVPVPASHDDVDLVRVYLQHIGKRKLLKAHEEVVIGERIEVAQRELLAAMAELGRLEAPATPAM